MGSAIGFPFDAHTEAKFDDANMSSMVSVSRKHLFLGLVVHVGYKLKPARRLAAVGSSSQNQPRSPDPFRPLLRRDVSMALKTPQRGPKGTFSADIGK